MGITERLTGAAQKFVLYIAGLLSFTVRRLLFVGKSVPAEDKLTDFLEVFKSTRIYLLFNLIALFIFTLLPQGKDIILIMIEDLSDFNPGSVISLLIGLIGWSVVSEFGARYKVYITDNSGLALSDERVNYRKEVQKVVATFYLLLPTLIVLASTVIVSLNNITNWEWYNIWPFATIVLLLLLTFGMLSRFYLDDGYINALRKRKVWFKIKKHELKWIDKLYGIYNDHVLMVRKASNFKSKDDPEDQELKNTYQRFQDILESLPPRKDFIETGDIESFPRDYIIQDELAPIEFNEVQYHPDNYQPVYDEKTDQFKNEVIPHGYYRWVYKNNPSFYKTLHLQVHVIAISSLIVMLIISTKFLISYEVLGSPGLVCLSFGCWLGIYTGLLYIDSRYRRKFHFSLRWLMVAWFFIVSYINLDHPVRKNIDCCNDRLDLKEHFSNWKNAHMSDSNRCWVMTPADYATWMKYPADSTGADSTSPLSFTSKDSFFNKNAKYPVFFITAEGGALRTGAFTAMLLAKLQDSFPAFKNNIYAFSSVSGGSVGVGFFNAVSYMENDSSRKQPGFYQAVTRGFFSQDQLSPVIGKMFYADILNYFWPSHVENFDRAIALEKSWECSYARCFNKAGDENVFSQNFTTCFKNKLSPAWFINTTEVETGLQCYLSNVRPNDFLFQNDRDLFLKKMRGGINYSTAINFSARFPLFSPSAALQQDDCRTYHYVDGGYVENTGAKTMLEIIQSLRASLCTNNILPYVIQVKFGGKDAWQQTGFINEISSVFDGIYNTRSGASATYTALLKKEVKKLHGQFIEIPLDASAAEVPMSWVFSRRSLNNLDTVISHITVRDTLNALHQVLPFYQKNQHVQLKTD